MSSEAKRPVAVHVQAAISGMVQPKMVAPARGRVVAAHVQRACTAGVSQAKPGRADTPSKWVAPGVVAQRAPAVIQLATRLSSPVHFVGSAYELEQLVRQWGPPNGTTVLVMQTDYVGHMYTVRFTNNNGPAISLATANGWVQAGINHYGDSDSSSSDSESDSDE